MTIPTPQKRAQTKPISIITKIKFREIMLRRHRSSRMRKTKKIKIELITTSVHLICKKIRKTVFLQRLYWAVTADGIEAFNYHAFDEETQKEISQKCMHLKNLDFWLRTPTRNGRTFQMSHLILKNRPNKTPVGQYIVSFK